MESKATHIVYFFNQSIDFKYRFYTSYKETKKFVWLQNVNTDAKIKVGKKSNRVWCIDNLGEFETAKCNTLKEI